VSISISNQDQHGNDEGNQDGIPVDSTRRKKTLTNPLIERMQRRHFILFDVLPALGTAAALATWGLYPLGAPEVVALVAMWLLTGVGITVGYHRLFTHRSFRASPATRAVLAVLAGMAGQGGVISWAVLHRRHHEYSDRPGDPHSPNLVGSGRWARLRGWLHAHLTWMVRHDYPSVVHYGRDLLRDRVVARVDQRYHLCVVLGLALPAVAVGLARGSWMGVLSGLLWGGAIRMFLLGQIIWSINSFLHMTGGRAFHTPEQSHNSGWLAPLSMGESWHNNHHAFPGSASFGLAWYRLDPGFWCIRLLQALGLAWDVRVPSRERIEARRRELLRHRHDDFHNDNGHDDNRDDQERITTP
jgi:stearoyl-CoA desaturase (Delta-9 desaturase)